MKQTLLEMVQAVLSAMDSDEVNSISDTVEADQVALLLKNLYYDIAVDIGVPEHESLFQLDASGDNTLPVLMTVPSNVSKVHWIKYNNIESGDTYPDWKQVELKPWEEFLDFVMAHREDTSDVGSQSITNNGETFEIVHRTDKHPDFYSVVDDDILVFDSYKTTLDTTLQKNKTMCHGVLMPVFSLVDGFIPDFDATQFPYFLNRAKVRAFAELKQSDHAEAGGEARRQKVILQKRQRKVPDQPELDKRPNYGRK